MFKTEKDSTKPCLLDIADAAIFLGLKLSYLRYLIQKKISPKFIQPTGKYGKIYFSVDDLTLWIETKKKETNDYI